MAQNQSTDWHRRASSLGERIGRFVNWANSFWERMTEGLEVQELWVQFKEDARASYGLYSKEVDWASSEGESRRKRFLRIGRALFWAMMLKLTPPRRVLLLVALVFLFIPEISVRTSGPSPNLQFNTGALHFVAGLALVILLAFELADRVTMKRDLEIAREIQTLLVPEIPPVAPGVDIAFRTRAANTVAGDYYDAFLHASDVSGLASDRLLVVVADVAGKGVPAALLMATFQASLRTLAATPKPLVELVAGLNRYACAHSLGGRRYTTAFFAELDPATRELNYVNAGHNAPILRRTSGKVERLETGGLPLGIKPSDQYDSGRAALSPLDLLVIFSDGVVEAHNEKGEEYGEQRLLDLLNAGADGTASKMLKQLLASVDSFVGPARQHDDITCLILKCV